MTTTTQTLRGARAAREARPLGARLGAALERFLDGRRGHRLISGDADSSLLAIARDLEIEDRGLTGRFGA
jgi:hypothetical protein